MESNYEKVFPIWLTYNKISSRVGTLFVKNDNLVQKIVSGYHFDIGRELTKHDSDTIRLYLTDLPAVESVKTPMYIYSWTPAGYKILKRTEDSNRFDMFIDHVPNKKDAQIIVDALNNEYWKEE